jgi:hypothetical protein
VISAADPREKMDDEITPISAKMSNFQSGHLSNTADKAIDRDWDTSYIARYNGDGDLWIEINLDEVYCVKKFLAYYSKDHKNALIFTCSSDSNECTCVQGSGGICTMFSLTVSGGEAADEMYPHDNDCKYGDKVKLEQTGDWAAMTGSELITIGKQGEMAYKNLT